MYEYLYDNIKISANNECNFKIDGTNKNIKFDFDLSKTDLDKPHATDSTHPDFTTDPSKVDFGDHSLIDKVWQIKIDATPSDIVGAKKIRVTQIPDLPSANVKGLSFSINSINLPSSGFKIQIIKYPPHDTWILAIGTDDVRVQVNGNVGATIFNLDSPSLLYLTYDTNAKKFVLFYSIIP